MKTFRDFLKEDQFNNGLYVSVIPNLQQFWEYMRSIKLIIQNIEFVTDPHITIVYSDKVISDEYANQTFLKAQKFNFIRRAIPNKIEFWEGHDDKWYLCLVLLKDNLELLNQIYVKAGYTPKTFPEFKPHITLSVRDFSFESQNNEIEKANQWITSNPTSFTYEEEILCNLRD